MTFAWSIFFQHLMHEKYMLPLPFQRVVHVHLSIVLLLDVCNSEGVE